MPHYPKIRLTATDLIRFAGQIAPALSRLVDPGSRGEIRVDLRFISGPRYLAKLFESKLSPTRTARFVQACRLSRYVGLVRFTIGPDPFIDVLYDTTDIRRDADLEPPILAFVPYREEDASTLGEFAKSLPGPPRLA